MDNKEIYKRTLGFSCRAFFAEVLSLLILGGCAALGFLVSERTFNKGLIGLAVGCVVGLILLVIVLRYMSYEYKAAQIAMMTKAITEGALPDDVIGEGKKIVKERFTTVAAFFLATGLIKGIFNEIGNAIESLGRSVGGDKGGTVGSVISTVLQTVVNYLCDCCLGWVFYRKDVKAARATCEGAVLYFRHGKTLLRNMGRVFGIGLASLIPIGGAFFGIAYLIMSRFPAAFATLTNEIVEAVARNSAYLNPFFTNPANMTLACAALVGAIMWAIIHSVFVRPFVLVGVLRNYLVSGMEELPTEDSFALLDGKSKKFRKLHAELA